MDEQAHMIFSGLEAPIPIMFLDPLEFVAALTCFGFGIISDLWMLGTALSVGVLVGSHYLKRGAKQGTVQHALWSLGLQFDPPLRKRFFPAWVNDFVQ